MDPVASSQQRRAEQRAVKHLECGVAASKYCVEQAAAKQFVGQFVPANVSLHLAE